MYISVDLFQEINKNIHELEYITHVYVGGCLNVCMDPLYE